MHGPAIVMVRVVCLSLCVSHANVFETKMDIWLLGNSNRNLGFPIQDLSSDLRAKVRFRHFGCFRVGTSPIVTNMDNYGPCQWVIGHRHRSGIIELTFSYDHTQADFHR